MKKYKLLKDLPEVKAGAIFEEMERGIFGCVIDTGHSTKYPLEYIVKYPEWFKLIEEKEFTESDMINFGRWAFNSLSPVVFANNLRMKEKISELRSKKCTN